MPSPLLLAAGLALLYVSGDRLVVFAAAIAERLGLTPSVIGLTVVAAGTSAPELFVSLIAAAEGRPTIAVANVVGSNIANLTLILGLTAILRPIPMGQSLMRLDYPFVLLATWIGLLLARDLSLDRLEGAFLVGSMAGYWAYSVMAARALLPRGESADIGRLVPAASDPWSRRGGWLLAAGLAASLAGLAAGSHLFVAGASRLASALGVSDRLIGLTIVAVGTSTPELVASAAAALKGQHEMAVANLVGSNAFNLLLILGTCAAIRPLPISPALLQDFWAALAACLALAPFVFLLRRLPSGGGWALVAGYCAYLLRAARIG